jgi:hypothetical protein
MGCFFSKFATPCYAASEARLATGFVVALKGTATQVLDDVVGVGSMAERFIGLTRPGKHTPNDGKITIFNG